MKRAVLTIVYIVAAGLLAGCAPLIHVENRSQIGVRAVVQQGPKESIKDVLRLPPKAAESVIGIEGTYRVFAAPDGAWGKYIKDLRNDVAKKVRDPQTLTADQVRDITQRLGNLIQTFESSANREIVFDVCGGTIGNSEDDIRVQIDVAPNGALHVACGSSPKKTKSP